MLRKFLDLIGSLFVYTSPPPHSGYARFLLDLPPRKLKSLAGTNSHYSKQKLVEMIVKDSPSMSIR